MNWNRLLAMEEQHEWHRHASFMNELVTSGFVKSGGPLEDGEEILLIVHAVSGAEINARLEQDPWTPMRLLEVVSVKRWRVLLGAGR